MNMLKELVLKSLKLIPNHKVPQFHLASRVIVLGPRSVIDYPPLIPQHHGGERERVGGSRCPVRGVRKGWGAARNLPMRTRASPGRERPVLF